MHEAGAPRFVEVGPGKVLARLGKRILKGVPVRDPRRRTHPCLAPRSRRSCTRSPATRRATAAARRRRAPPRSSASATTCRPRSCPNGRDRRAHRRRRRTGSSSARASTPAAAPRRTSARATSPCSPPAARCRTRASTPLDLDFVLVATMSAGRDHAELRAAASPTRSAPTRAARVRHRRRLHRLPRRARAGRRADRGRPRGARAADRRRDAHPHHRLRRQEDRRCCSATARARSCSARPAAGAGIGPIDLLRRRRPRRHDRAPRTRTRMIRMDGISTFKIAVKRLSRVDRLRRRRAPASSSTTSTCSSTTRPTRASSRRSASGSTSSPAKVADYIAQLGNTSRGLDPADAVALRARTAACARATRCCSPRSARASPGAPA